MYEALGGHGFQVEGRTGCIILVFRLVFQRKVFDRVFADASSQHDGGQKVKRCEVR